VKPKVPRRQEPLVRADNTVMVSAYCDDLRYDVPMGSRIEAYAGMLTDSYYPPFRLTA
jgi:hypothetical protein